MQGLLWIATRSGILSRHEAKTILEQFSHSNTQDLRALKSAHIVDLDLAAGNANDVTDVTVAVERLEQLGIYESSVPY
jgi:hypothetical protein